MKHGAYLINVTPIQGPNKTQRKKLSQYAWQDTRGQLGRPKFCPVNLKPCALATKIYVKEKFITFSTTSFIQRKPKALLALQELQTF
jgi:hypothetical protein